MVVLHSEPTKAVLYPRTRVHPLPLRDSPFLKAVVDASPDALLAGFKVSLGGKITASHSLESCP
jgi:hypothetical protein